MPRGLSSAIVEATNAQQSGAVLLDAIVIEHDDLVTPIRLVKNSEDVSIDGELFTASEFNLNPPADKDQGVPRAQVEIPNPGRALTPAIRTLSGNLWFTLMRVSASDQAADPPEFDTIEVEYLPLRLLNVAYNSMKVRGELTYDTIDQKQWPSGQFTPDDFPGMF